MPEHHVVPALANTPDRGQAEMVGSVLAAAEQEKDHIICVCAIGNLGADKGHAFSVMPEGHHKPMHWRPKGLHSPTD